jgi:hypothetical protein
MCVCVCVCVCARVCVCIHLSNGEEEEEGEEEEDLFQAKAIYEVDTGPATPASVRRDADEPLRSTLLCACDP